MNPTNEHREQARDLIHAARNSVKCSPQHRGDSGPYCLECPDLRDEAVIVAVARALSSRDSEIREVLERLATYRNPLCWCPPNTEAEPHTEACRMTTALYGKVAPLQSENPDPKVRE